MLVVSGGTALKDVLKVLEQPGMAASSCSSTYCRSAALEAELYSSELESKDPAIMLAGLLRVSLLSMVGVHHGTLI